MVKYPKSTGDYARTARYIGSLSLLHINELRRQLTFFIEHCSVPKNGHSSTPQIRYQDL